MLIDKIRKKYAGLGDTVVSVRLERSPRGGLGLSLAGHRDRSRMAVFICGLHPAGAAAKANPPVKVGDEILEGNKIPERTARSVPRAPQRANRPPQTGP
ncbi:unnamed protein product [Spodoptera exigua]|nr:unnamed protein product [Spodoptera exigua]